MPIHIVVGTQFGDEGKGKITDFFSESVDAVVRYQGGTNAGHTVVANNTKFRFHLLPSGIFQGKKCFIGAGACIEPFSLKKEINEVKKVGIKPKLVVDFRTHIIMPYHILLDKEIESSKNSIGTTKKGIGPCYADRALRQGIRFFDILDKKRLRERLEKVLPEKIVFLKAKKIGFDFTLESLLKKYSLIGEKLKVFAGDASKKISSLLEAEKKVLFEGAQGTFLDNDFGTYPFVTSSHPIAGSIFTGTGLGLTHVNRVTGVIKAYTSRVGEGPFPTELNGKIAEFIREKGKEYGTTTGRPRRIGWLDMPMLRTSNRFNGFTDIALTKIDVLSELKKVRYCSEYELNGERLLEMPSNLELLSECKPVYKKVKSFKLKGTEKSFSELDVNARKYINLIEKELKTRVKLVSIGPDRKQTILR